ncbi:MAG: DUF4738 domain-containing protein [Bacteroidaceae bacterium]|nr:DUF4738 domain-containing protein [Bacteroidaceae bacterium]
MKQIFLLLFALVMFASCGGKDEKNTEAQDQAPKAAVIADTKGAAKEDVTNEYTLKLGNRDYDITVHSFSDEEGGTFKDDFGDEFYGNRVSIRILRDGEVLAEREFSLESFDSYIPSKYKGKVVLQGIAPDEQKSTAAGIVFGVSIGDAGTDESRVALILTIVPGSGNIDIRKDDTPDSTGRDQGTDEG